MSKIIDPADKPSQNEFRELIEELEALEYRCLPSKKTSQRRRAVQSRLVALLASSTNIQERRRYLRIPCDLWVTLSTGKTSRPGVIEDIGIGGVFAATLLEAAPGDSVTVDVSVRQGICPHPLRLEGTIAWVGSYPKQQGLGISFAGPIDPAVTQQLKQLLSALLRRLVPEELA